MQEKKKRRKKNRLANVSRYAINPVVYLSSNTGYLYFKTYIMGSIVKVWV